MAFCSRPVSQGGNTEEPSPCAVADFIFEKNRDSMDSTALICVSRDGTESIYSYRDLDIMSNKAANMLSGMGIRKGDRVFLYLDRSAETFFFTLGILKIGAVFCPLFPSFGPDAVEDRFIDCGGKLIIVEDRLVDNVGDFPHLVVDRKGDFDRRLLSIDSEFVSPVINSEDIAIIHYTSGTTGKPKGAVHCHGAVLGHYETTINVLELTKGTKYWCTADPAWVTGTTYGILGPLSAGAQILVCEPGYRSNQVLGTLVKYEISIWYTAPTLLRMLMREDKAKSGEYTLPYLKKIFSIGEALNPEVFHWVDENLGIKVMDTWFQTETGSIMIANDGSFPIKPSSMGKPVLGINAGILDEDYNDADIGVKGSLALRTPWSSMFRDYWGNRNKYESRFHKGWYITGDLAYRDEEGYFYFVSREDDVINTAGHLLSPYEVERVLASHPSVEEVAVAGMPDKIMGEAVKACIVLKENYEPSPQLQMEYRMLVRNRLSPFASPQKIEFVNSIPKTESGKTIRHMG